MQRTLSQFAVQLLRWDLQLVLVLSFALAVLWLIPRNHAALKHWLVMTLVAATLAMPVFSLLLPPLALLQIDVDAPQIEPAEDKVVPLGSDLIPAEIAPPQIAASPTHGDNRNSARPSVNGIAMGHRNKLATAENRAARLEEEFAGSSSSSFADWRVLLVSIWASGVLMLSVRLVLAWDNLRRRWGDSLPATPAIEKSLNVACQQLEVRRKVALRRSHRCNSPMTWGNLKPKILLPVEANSWSRERLEAILLHEVAHVKRYDSAWEYLIHLLCITHWFQPLAWGAAWQGRIQRERACDNAVLRQGILASEYAECILAFAAAPRLPGGAIAMANVGGLRNRLKLILNNSSRPSLTVVQAFLSGAGAVGICLFVASLQLYALPASLSPSERESTTRTFPAKGQVEQTPVRLGSGKFFVDGGVWSATYSPDGDTLATISHRGSLELWDTTTGERTLKIIGHVRGLAFSPVGKRIATRGSLNTPIRIWDSITGKLVSSLTVETPTSAEAGNLEAIDLKFVDDATLITVHPQIVRHWDLTAGEENLSQRRLLRLGRRISMMGGVSPLVSEDGRLLAEHNGERVYIDELSTQSTTAAIEYTALVPGRSEFCDSGGMIAFFGGEFASFRGPRGPRSMPILAFETRSKQRIRVPDTDGIIAKATADPYRPRIFAITHEDYENWQLQILDLKAGSVVSKIPWPSGYAIEAVHPDGEQIALSDSVGICLMNLTTGELFPNASDLQRGSISDLAYSPDGKLIATANGSSRVTIWDSESGTPESRVAFFPKDRGEANRVAFTADGSALIATGWFHALAVGRKLSLGSQARYAVRTAQQRYNLANSLPTTHWQYYGETHLTDYADAMFTVQEKKKGHYGNPDRNYISLIENDSFEWDRSLSRSESVVDSYTSDKGKSIWLLSPGGRINRWNTETGEKLDERDLPIGHGAASTCDIQAGCVVCSPTGFDISIIDIGDGSLKAVFQSSHTGDPIRLIRLSPTANQVGLVTDSGWLVIHDASTGKSIVERQLSSAATAMKFSPSGNHVLVGLADGTAVQWPTVGQ